MDLKNMTSKQALAHAKLISGLTLADIGERSGIPRAVVQRYLNENDHEYYPGLHRIPDLCAALGNYVLVDWLVENTRELRDGYHIESICDLMRQMSRITKELGDVAKAIDEGSADNKLTQAEIRRITGEALDVELCARRLREGLQYIAGNPNHFSKMEG